MPQKTSPRTPRTWGTRFDPLPSSPPSSPTPDEAAVALDAVTVPETPTKGKEDKMPHDASVFVGRSVVLYITRFYSSDKEIIVSPPTWSSPSSPICFLSICRNTQKSRTSKSSATKRAASALSSNARLVFTTAYSLRDVQLTRLFMFRMPVLQPRLFRIYRVTPRSPFWDASCVMSLHAPLGLC